VERKDKRTRILATAKLNWEDKEGGERQRFVETYFLVITVSQAILIATQMGLFQSHCHADIQY
jgi:hypothetical protein